MKLISSPAARAVPDYYPDFDELTTLVTTDRTTLERLATHLQAARRRFGTYRLSQSLSLIEQTLGEE